MCIRQRPHILHAISISVDEQSSSHSAAVPIPSEAFELRHLFLSYSVLQMVSSRNRMIESQDLKGEVYATAPDWQVVTTHFCYD